MPTPTEAFLQKLNATSDRMEAFLKIIAAKMQQQTQGSPGGSGSPQQPNAQAAAARAQKAQERAQAKAQREQARAEAKAQRAADAAAKAQMRADAKSKREADRAAKAQMRSEAKAARERAMARAAAVATGARNRASGNAAIGRFGGAVAGGVASSFTGMIDTFKGVVGTAQKFVAALNPAAPLVLGQAFRDLAATIGTALQPVITAAVGIVRQFADSLAPAMNALRPVIESLSKTFAQVANVFSGAFSSILQSIAPLLKGFADVVQALVPVFQAYYATIAGLVEAVAGLFKGADWKSAASSLKATFRDLAAATLRATVHVLKFVDALAGTNLAFDFVRGVRRSLRPEDTRGQAAKAAPLNAGVGGLAEFGRQVTTAALLAGPGGAQTKDQEEAMWRKQTLASLTKIAFAHESLLGKMIDSAVGRIEKKFDDAVRDMKRGLVPDIGSPLKRAGAGAVMNPGNPIGGFLGGLFGG